MSRVIMACLYVVLIAAVTVAQAPPPSGNNVDYSNKDYPKAVAGRKFECKATYTEGAGPPAWACDYVAFTGQQTYTVRGVKRNLTVQASIEQKPIPNPFELDVTFATTDAAKVTVSAGFSRTVNQNGAIIKEEESKFRGPANVTPLP